MQLFGLIQAPEHEEPSEGDNEHKQPEVEEHGVVHTPAIVAHPAAQSALELLFDVLQERVTELLLQLIQLGDDIRDLLEAEKIN